MRLNFRTWLAVTATALLILPSVGSIPLDNQDDIALKKRNDAIRNDAGINLTANEAYSTVNLPRAPGAPRVRPKPRPDGSDAPKGPAKPDNPAIGDPKTSKCQRNLQGRCSDEEDMGDDELEDEDISKGYLYYHNSGTRKVDAMNAKMDEIRADPNGNHDKPMPQLDGSYKIRYPLNKAKPSDLGFDSVARVFDDLGLNKLGTELKGAKVDATNGGKSSFVGDNYISTKGDGVIVAKWNNMASRNIAASPLRWSDLTISVLREVRESNGPRFADIKYIIRDGINNAGTKEVIDDIHARLPNKIVNGKGTFDLASPNPDEVEAAKTLIGTPNGGGVFFVIDFPKLFGNRKITRVHTWRYDEKWAMAMELGPM